MWSIVHVYDIGLSDLVEEAIMPTSIPFESLLHPTSTKQLG